MSNEGMHHITPFSTYLKVCIALFILTILTVVCHEMQLGVFAAPVAFLIATVKAALVVMIFMHLKYDSIINRVIFGLAFALIFLLFVISSLDTFTRVLVTPTL